MYAANRLITHKKAVERGRVRPYPAAPKEER
jgi:hypothetical protein